jgi:hypothetical protein
MHMRTLAYPSRSIVSALWLDSMVLHRAIFYFLFVHHVSDRVYTAIYGIRYNLVD